MMKRRRLIAGNWKMNGTLADARELAGSLARDVPTDVEVDVVVCPPFTALAAVARELSGSAIGLGAQNMYFQEKGAFTGEISPLMLLDAGCRYVILGHSERRRQMDESSQAVNRKAKLALQLGLTPIVCIGETLSEREAGRTEQIIREQVQDSLEGLSGDQLALLVLAYEPVWAIGTGKVATPEQAEEVHQLVRRLLPGGSGDSTRVLYGGSVAPENAGALLAKADIDGALVGGASLKSESFAAIIRAA
ncbi:MAG: triose-phosphate isomerase [Chloroflexota bacterium]|nr:triose-phosphate isomerase [Chloroflexota bacterium]